MILNKRYQAVALVVCCVSLTACASLRALVGLGPIRPKVRVSSIDVVKATLVSFDLVIGIHVDNPNDFALDFDKLHYQFVAAGLPIASGSYLPHIVVKENSGGDARLPLSIDAAAAMQLVKKLMAGDGDVTAVTTAVADFHTPFGSMTVDFDDQRPLRKLAGF